MLEKQYLGATVEYKLKEFCRLTGLTRKALLIYEDKELLVPARVDAETGYRYYSENDLILGTKIALMRSLSFGIEEIADALSSSSATHALIKAKEHSIHESFQQAQHGLTIANLNKVQQFSLNKPMAVEAVSYEQILTIEGRGSSRDLSLHFDLLHRHCCKMGYVLIDAPFTWYFKDSNPNELHFKACYPVKEPWVEQQGGVHMEYAPRMSVAFRRHFGSYELLPISYKKLKQSCRENEFIPRGDYLEIYRTHNLKSTVKDSTTLITDIGAVLC